MAIQSVESRMGDSTVSSPHDESLATVSEDEPCPPTTEKPPKIIEVKCGPLHAKMHVELFLCPGIHQQCIELDGEMISPKEFTVRANKDKQKDWKGSIRIGKSNLRSLMEMRSFDFFNHSVFCSAKCQSRNYITPKGSDRSEGDKDSRRSSKSSIEQLMAMQPKLNYSVTPDCDSLSTLVQLSHALNNNNNLINNNNNLVKDEMVDVDDSLIPKHPTAENVSSLMSNQATSFWSQMNQLGLVEDVVETFQREVEIIRQQARQNALPPKACDILSRLCLSLGLGEAIAQRIRTRQYQNSIEELQREERKRRLDALSAQSLVELKRPRIQYPADPLHPPSENPLEYSAFSFPASHVQMELLFKLAALSQPTPDSAHLPTHFTDALLKMQSQHA